MGEKQAVHTFPGEALEVTGTRASASTWGSARGARRALRAGPPPLGRAGPRRCGGRRRGGAPLPTGSLAYRRRDGGPPETPDADNRITVSNRGPLYARGDLRIAGAPGDMPGVATRAALCRCGHSANKPFCDNAHEADGFADRGPVGTAGEPPAQAGGLLEVTPLPNGPLLVRGNLTLVAGDGRAAWQGTKAALCRCGGSANKPFCDGAHQRIGFTTE